MCLECTSGLFSRGGVFIDYKVNYVSSFVELQCKNSSTPKTFYLEYDKPDVAQTVYDLVSQDQMRTEVPQLQSLLHPKWTQSLASLDIQRLLKKTFNFKEAVKASNCSSYSVLLTYENSIVEEGQKLYLVILFCPKRAEDDRVMYAVVATVLNSDWFKPVLVDKLKNRPPDGF